MQKHSFEQGKIVLVEGKLYRLLNCVQIKGLPHWQVIQVGVEFEPIVECHSLELLEQQLGDGTLEFHEEQNGSTATGSERRKSRLQLSNRPEVERNYITFWRAVIRAVSDASFRRSANSIGNDTLSQCELSAVLKDAGARLGTKIYGKPKNVSVSYYYKIRKRYISGDLTDLEPNYRARGNRKQLHPFVKRALNEAITERLQECSHAHGTARSPTFTSQSVQTRLLRKLLVLREAHPGLVDVLVVPSRTTVCKAIAAGDQYQLLAARKGITFARQSMRRPYGHAEPEACLEQTQYDETRLDVYCYWGERRVPLGKPYFSWMIDIYSGGILGFYLGFEPPGDEVFSSVLRHCCLPKSYIANHYPDIAIPYLMSGIPRLTTFDNSLSAHGKTLEQIYGDLDIQYKFCRPREPYTKPDVESAFSVINRSLLQNMPGYAPPLKLTIGDYDPLKNGLISFEQLLYIIHKWIMERNSKPLPHSTSHLSPNERWVEGTKLVKPQFLNTKMNLDAMFGIMRDATVNHKGVRYKNLWYYSDQLHEFRYRNGSTASVKIKVNPSDISKVYLLDNERHCFIECNSTNPSITSGMTLFCHKITLKHQEKLFGRDRSVEAYLQAKLDLEDQLAAWMSEDFGVGTNARVARAHGLGTHHSNRMRIPAQPHPQTSQDQQFSDGSPPPLEAKSLATPLIIPTLPTSQLPG